MDLFEECETFTLNDLYTYNTKDPDEAEEKERLNIDAVVAFATKIYERGKRDGKIEGIETAKILLEDKAWMPGEATLFNKLHFELCEELEKLKGEK